MTFLTRPQSISRQPVTRHKQAHHSRQLKSSTITLVAIVCILVVTFVGLTLHRAAQIQEQIKAQALLNLSLQDLILQSSHLRHMANQHPAQLRLSLEKNGYDSAQSLLNQLSARLAVLEALPSPGNSLITQNTLRKLLLDMDQSLNDQHVIKQAQIDQWHVQLKTLNHELEKATDSSHTLIEQLLTQHKLMGIGLIIASTFPWVVWMTLKLKPIETLRRKHRKKIAANSSDSLTDLLNQQGWLHILHAHHKSKNEPRHASALALVQIDYFKQYNATYGPTVGDARLQKFAAMLSTNFRPQDTLARLENGQFAVLVPDCGAVETKRIIDRIRHDPNCDVEFSTGICELSQQVSLERILALADHALNKAKEEGGNRSCMA